MDIIFQGKHSTEEVVESLAGVLKMFKERYQISQYREMRFCVTLVDAQGDDVELVDSESADVFKYFEVYREGYELLGRDGEPKLKLVVDNTKQA